MWFPFLTNYFQVMNCFISLIASIIVFYIVLPQMGHLTQLSVYQLSGLFTLAICFLCFKKWRAPGEDESRVIQIKVSFGAIGTCGIVAIIWAYFFWNGDLLLLFYVFITFNLISLFLYIPAHAARGAFQLSYRKKYGCIIVGAVVHIVVLVLEITIALLYEQGWQVILFQVYYSLFTASFVDLCISLTEGIEEYTEPIDRSSLIRPATNSECPICAIQYSEDVIPRILTKCEHTVCQECAGNLMGETNKISCPTCRQETIVNGSVDTLPMNFTVLEMIRGNEIV